jgi:hypothetical protein
MDGDRCEDVTLFCVLDTAAATDPRPVLAAAVRETLRDAALSVDSVAVEKEDVSNEHAADLVTRATLRLRLTGVRGTPDQPLDRWLGRRLNETVPEVVYGVSVSGGPR